MKIRIVFLVLFLQTVAGAQVQNTFFGFNWAANNVGTPPDNNPWPTAIGPNFGRFRTWDTPTGWQATESSRRVYSWTNLDRLFTDVFSPSPNGNPNAKIEITTGAGDVPSWALDSTSCVSNSTTGLPCDATDTTTVCSNIPSAVRSGAALFDGDCQWQEYVYTLAMHECATCTPTTGVYQGKLTFRSLSPGNEVDTNNFITTPCSSTNTSVCDALIKMQADACKLLKWVDSTFTGCATPSFTDALNDGASTYASRASSYIPSGQPNMAGDYTDVLVGHIYGDPNPNHAGQPEIAGTCGTPCRSWPTKIGQFTSLLTSANHMNGKLFRIDEGGWGRNFQTNTGGQACTSDTTCGCAPPSSPIRACMDANSLANESIEGSSDTFTETNAPAPAYLVRSYLEVLSSGAESFFWYNPGSDEWGSFADCPSSCNSAITSSNYTATAYAYASLYQWAVGSTFSTSGIQNTSGTTKYTYGITAKSSSNSMGCSSTAAASTYAGTIAWDLSSASSLSCGTGTGRYTQYCSAYSGTSQPFSKDSAHTCTSGGSIPLGPTPILFEHN